MGRHMTALALLCIISNITWYIFTIHILGRMEDTDDNLGDL